MAAPSDAAGEQYFTASPNSTSRPKTVHLKARGIDVTLTSDRGTFSPNRIDPGTALLLDRAPEPPSTGRFLDLGCGYGPMAMVLALSAPGADVVAIDVNERSRDLTAANAKTLELDNVTTAAPDDVEGGFDLIWSNPPIRIGKDALHDLLLRWLGRLNDDGTAVLVVNRHLGADSLQRWLGSKGHETERLASRAGYRLLRASAAGGVDGEP
ncbi:class I SAM-dependent methyltransferase [Actinospongicola halichondriae]|uniref:class I SAM-dependent methyltransferase n=1 Tax=Actinospongicola halichondriae TaxID=3236844 RepID=UPI003D5D2595